MKKILLVLGMITCILGLTACGSEEVKTPEQIALEESASSAADQIVNAVNMAVQSGLEGQYVDEVSVAAINSWKSAQEDIGSFQGILDHEIDVDDDTIVVNVLIDGTLHDAKVEVIFEDTIPTSITTNVIYSFGELMEKAALNTVIGMGTVFVVLILICFIISAFVLIPKVQAIFSKKEKQTEEVRKEAVADTAAQVVEAAEEDVSDDLELVAVIAAAIAASEGAASTDGFVVRSIRRANTNKWQRA